MNSNATARGHSSSSLGAEASTQTIAHASEAPRDIRPPASADLFPGVGFRIRQTISRPSVDVAQMFRPFALADISDHLNRLYTADPAIRCLSGEERRLVGPACTVKVYPGDNLMVHKVLDIAQPGDVVVVDARGSSANAVLGDTISMKARHRRIAGFIVDGYIRDLAPIRALKFPVYARGETPIGPLHRAPGEINYPVCCGGIAVMPGDIVIADQSGIVVLPQDCIEALYVELVRHNERAEGYLERVRQGHFSNAWVDQLLENAQCKLDS